MGSLHLLQVTDTHLFVDRSATKNGVQPAKTLNAVLDKALAYRTPYILAATGDIANEPVRETYEYFLEVVRARYSGNLLVIPGNHDSGGLMREIFPDCSNSLGSWTVTCLDTHVDGKVAGHVTKQNLDQLEAELRVTSGHVLVLGHHPIVDVGARWLDAHRVDNGMQVVSLLQQHRGSASYLCGHIHQEFDVAFDGMRCLATPSTCWQFARDVDEFAMDDLPPGWRWLELFDDGSIHTEVFRLNTA